VGVSSNDARLPPTNKSKPGGGDYSGGGGGEEGQSTARRGGHRYRSSVRSAGGRIKTGGVDLAAPTAAPLVQSSRLHTPIYHPPAE